MIAFTTTVKVYRPSGAYVEGVWQEGVDPQPFTIQASVQPLMGRELQALDEGRRQRAAVRLYTEFQLRPVADGKNPDRLTLDGQDFEVISVEDWTKGGMIPHFKAVASLLEQEPQGAV